MSNPIFLTRQTKKLLDNFTRDLKAGGSISLLYGDPGTGKTRIMQELTHSRMPESGVHWVDLSARDSGDDSKQDRSSQVEAAFKAAIYGDIVIADHFESAFQKTRHQLFLSWATAGVEKNLRLIVASNTEGSNELRQLSQQYQVQVKNYQTLPFNDDEVEAFLGFYLFPDQPVGKISMPGNLRVQFAVTHGIIGRIIDIAESERARIKYKPMNEPRPNRKGSGMIVAAVGLFTLVAAVALFILNSWEKAPESTRVVANEPSSQVAITEPKVVDVADSEVDVVDKVISAPEPGDLAEADVGVLGEVVAERGSVTEPEAGSIGEVASEPGVVTETAAAVVVEVAVESEPESIDNSAQAAVAKPIPEIVNAPVSAIAPEPESSTVDTSAPREQATITQEPVKVAKLATVVVEDGNTTQSASADASDEVRNQPAAVRFQRQLQVSMDWIKRNDKGVGTIQIMLLSFENFDVNGFYRHVDNLASQQVDISRLRVFKTYTGNRKTYSVFYGEYESWKAAGKSKGKLPEVLRKNSPIPRSVGGIREEIRRLEAEN